MKGYTQHSIQTRTAEVWVWFVNICEGAEIEAPSLIPEWICSAWYGYNIRGYETGIKELWGIHSTCNGTSWACRFMYSGVALYHTSLSSVVSMYGRYFIIRLKSLHIYKSMMSNGKFVINNEIPLHYVVMLDGACLKYSIWNKTGYENLCGWGWTINGNRLLKQTTII